MGADLFLSPYPPSYWFFFFAPLHLCVFAFDSPWGIEEG